MCILEFKSALNHTELLSPSISALCKNWPYIVSISEVLVAEIDPAYADGEALCTHYHIPPQTGANCIIVAATRGQERRLAACLYPVGLRVDLNKTVRKALNARRVSLAPIEEVLTATNMEYGSITPLGLPSSWPLLIDKKLMDVSQLIIGSGKVNAKLSLPTKLLSELPNNQIINTLTL